MKLWGAAYDSRPKTASRFPGSARAIAPGTLGDLAIAAAFSPPPFQGGGREGGVDPGARRPGRGPSRPRSSVNYLAGRRPASFSRVARGRRDAGAPNGGTPLPTSPLKGGRSKRVRASGTSPTSLSTGRSAGDPAFTPPPWKGGGREGDDPGAGRPGRGPSRPRSSVNYLAGRRPASSFALRARPAGRRRSQGRDPPPDLPPEGGRSKRVRASGTSPTSLSTGRSAGDPAFTPPPLEGGRSGGG